MYNIRWTDSSPVESSQSGGHRFVSLFVWSTPICPVLVVNTTNTIFNNSQTGNELKTWRCIPVPHSCFLPLMMSHLLVFGSGLSAWFSNKPTSVSLCNLLTWSLCSVQHYSVSQLSSLLMRNFAQQWSKSWSISSSTITFSHSMPSYFQAASVIVVDASCFRSLSLAILWESMWMCLCVFVCAQGGFVDRMSVLHTLE